MGEAARGYLAAFCIDNKLKPKEVRNQRGLTCEVPRPPSETGLSWIGQTFKPGGLSLSR